MELLKKIVKSLLIGIAMGVVVALLTAKFIPDLIDRLENQTYYMRYYWKYMDLGSSSMTDESAQQKKDDTGIFIVDIDDRSMHKLGMYWNWNRSYHADITNALFKHFPATLSFDINFFDPEDNHYRERIDKLITRSLKMFPQALSIEEKSRKYLLQSVNYDEQFIKAIKEAGRVFNNVRMSNFNDYAEIDRSQIKARGEMEWHNSLKPSSCIELSKQDRESINTDKNIIDGIFPPLAQASYAIGHLNMAPNEDGVIREVPLLYSFGNNKPVYLPMSMRIAVSLFGTPNKEIIFKSGEYIDIGKPFKIFKDSNSVISFSYPNVTSAQVKLILEKSQEIGKLETGKSLSISTFTKIGRDENGGEIISMYHGDFPQELVDMFRKLDFDKIRNLKVGDSFEIGDETTFRRDSDVEWVIETPYGWAEYYVDEMDMKMLENIKASDFEKIKNGETKLMFHSFSVNNRGDKLTSSIPVLVGKTITELTNLKWSDIENMKPGTRKDIGESVRIPLTHNNKHIVTFFGRQKKAFNYYSYYDIMKNRVQGELEGKIFIVGSTVPAMFDIVNSAVSNDYPGVEVHASLLHSFLSNTFIRRLTPIQDFLILIIVGIFIGVISYLLKPLYSSILTGVLIFGYFLFAMTIFGSDNMWIEIVRPVITAIITYTAIMAYRYITEEKDRKFLQNTFKAYLSPELIDAMYKDKQMPSLGGDEGIRTAYFTDIQAFSTFSEQLGSPTRLVELLNEYLTEMTDSLLSHFGTLDKYEGDAIIAFYGAPMEMENHAHQACYTALDMQERLAKLRIKWSSEGDKWPEIVHNMRMRIGVNSGRITTGNMGSATRMNYTMMGDAVNLAARLESAAKQYGVYTMLSDATYDIVKDDFDFRQLDKITVVGKSEPVVVYELICEKGKMLPEIKELVDIYNEGLKLFYELKWDDCIKIMVESEKLEPYKEFTAGGISPSRKIIGYCENFKENSPGDDWDGVIKLTSK